MTAFISYREQLRQNALAHRQAGFHLHPYQLEAVEQAWAAWQAGHHSVLVSLPTGTGKTEVALDLMRRVLNEEPEGRALFLTHRRELVTQTADRLKIRLPQWANDVGLVMNGKCDDSKRIVVATVQSLVGHGSKWLSLLRRVQSHGAFALLVVDECHHAVAQGYRDVAQALQDSVPTLRHLGLTATPLRHDRSDLSQVYHLAYSRSVRWAVENGYLVPPEGVRVNTDIDLTGVRCKNGDYMDASLGQVLNTPAFNDLLVKLYQEFLPGLRTLVFCATVKHAEAIQIRFKQASISAGLIVGKTPDDERRAIIAAFVRGDTPVIVNVGVFTEGVDIPCAEGLLMARPTQSAMLYTQIVGRVLRLSPGKVKATIVDVTGTEQTLFTLDDMLESPSYRQTVKAQVTHTGHDRTSLSNNDVLVTNQKPLSYWAEMVDLLGRSPIAWYSIRGRSVASLAKQHYALLMPPGGPALARALQERLAKEASDTPEKRAKLEWQQEHINDFCLFSIHDGVCEPVDWDHDYTTLLSVTSTWMESKAERTLSDRQRGWRYTPASDRQAESLVRWGVVPSIEWLRAREREVGVQLPGGAASDLLSYKIALSVYSAAGFLLAPATERSDESAESRFRRLLREQRSHRDTRAESNDPKAERTGA
jgi:superfamily II DNA or RNA helicase